LVDLPGTPTGYPYWLLGTPKVPGAPTRYRKRHFQKKSEVRPSFCINTVFKGNAIGVVMVKWPK